MARFEFRQEAMLDVKRKRVQLLLFIVSVVALSITGTFLWLCDKVRSLGLSYFCFWVQLDWIYEAVGFSA